LPVHHQIFCHNWFWPGGCPKVSASLLERYKPELFLSVLFHFVWELKIKRRVLRLDGTSARPQRKGAHWGMGGARTAGGEAVTGPVIIHW
jgi:hypothetical protein